MLFNVVLFPDNFEDDAVGVYGKDAGKFRFDGFSEIVSVVDSKFFFNGSSRSKTGPLFFLALCDEFSIDSFGFVEILRDATDEMVLVLKREFSIRCK